VPDIPSPLAFAEELLFWKKEFPKFVDSLLILLYYLKQIKILLSKTLV